MHAEYGVPHREREQAVAPTTPAITCSTAPEIFKLARASGTNPVSDAQLQEPFLPACIGRMRLIRIRNLGQPYSAPLWGFFPACRSLTLTICNVWNRQLCILVIVIG